MTVFSQLPERRDIELFTGAAPTFQFNLGINLSGMSVYASVLVRTETGFQTAIATLGVTINSASQGTVSVSVPSSVSLDPRASSATWRLFTYEPSAADPATAVRTRLWGAVSVVSPASLTPSSPLYMRIEMVAGDEYTFPVNLGQSIAGMTLYATATYEFSGNGTSEPLIVSVTSAGSGLLNITVSETVSTRLVSGSDRSWRLYSIEGGGERIFRAGPITVYDSPFGDASFPGGNQATQAPVVTPATQVQIGSVFL